MYWSGPGHELAFELVNRSDSPIKILWDEAAFVDISGHSLRVIHNGVKLAERNSAQPPSIVAGKGKLSDMVFPSENVTYSTGQYTGGWHQKPMFPCTRIGYYCPDAEKLAKAYTGSTYRVLLPIQVGKESYPYTFVFNVNRAEVVTLAKGDDAINTKGAGPIK